MVCSFWAAATAEVGGQGENYARVVDITGWRFRREKVEVLEYEKWGWIRPI